MNHDSITQNIILTPEQLLAHLDRKTLNPEQIKQLETVFLAPTLEAKKDGLRVWEKEVTEVFNIVEDFRINKQLSDPSVKPYTLNKDDAEEFLNLS